MAEMERDMKTWTHHKHEVEMLAIQRGRMLEYDRAKSTIEALEGIHADQSSANERLQETVASLRAQLARQACDAKKELKALFDALDKDGDGKVTSKEWGSAISKNKEILAKFFGGASIKEIGAAFKRLDADGSKDLTWDEFVAGAMALAAQ